MTTRPGAAPDSQLAAALRAGRFVITAEISPPVSCRPEDLLAKARPLAGLADAVNVTDGAGARAAMAASTAAALLAQHGIEPVLQFTCRDRNRIAIQSDLIGAAACGVRNLLMLRGDDPGAGDQPDAKGVFDLDSVRLIETAARMRDCGELPTGRKIAGAPRFFIGCADMPIDPPAGWSPTGLKAKIAAGATFAQTQFCMDAGIVARYARRLADEGVPRDFHLVIGVVPLRSARSARWIRDNLFGSIIPDGLIARLEGAADAAAEGRRVCVELLQQLAETPGVAGAHIMAPGADEVVPAVIAEARRGTERIARPPARPPVRSSS
ncbi:MAG: methylenetetrahydrofolate reductase [Xanthobacteraceae bacterium]|nr:methylenetetrahydrofolate reductase [Xanthobacteraceae bacterium]